MQEQIYQSVWCQVFAATCVRLHDAEANQAADRAASEARWAARKAVAKWDDAHRTSSIVDANKGK